MIPTETVVEAGGIHRCDSAITTVARVTAEESPAAKAKAAQSQ